MSVELIILVARTALLAVFIGVISVCCTGAAMRRGEGAAGGAARILITLLAPATAFAFVGLSFWPLDLGASLVGAAWQGLGSVHHLLDRACAVWRSLALVSKIAVIVLFFASAIRMGATLSSPPTEGDSLLYHLPLTAVFVQDHSMWFTRAMLYPGAGELGEAIGAAATGNVAGIVAFELGLVIALALVGFGWARRAGASTDGAAASAVVAGSLPVVIEQIFTSQNDIMVCVLVACTCVLWRAAPSLASLSLGMLFATKVTAFFLVPAVALVMLAFEGWPFSVSDIALGIAIATPWYVRTWVITGSPIYAAGQIRWGSTIAAHFGDSWFWTLTALRNWGGLTVIMGLPALLLAWLTKERTALGRALPWLALVVYLAWIVMPNSAEVVPGTLDQIRDGWSVRYALFLCFILATGLTIVLDKFTRAPLAAFVALVAAAFALVRSAEITRNPLSFYYAALVALVALLITLALLVTQVRPRFALMTCALVVASLTMAIGSESMSDRWDATYLQWTTAIPANAVLLEPRIQASKQLAVLGARSFPFVGPNFQRRVYDWVIVSTPNDWISDLRRHRVSLLVTSNETLAINEPGFLKPRPEEMSIQAIPGVCLLETRRFSRIYGLDATSCRNSR